MQSRSSRMPGRRIISNNSGSRPRSGLIAPAASRRDSRMCRFGSILGEDGKAIKTRYGDPIELKALLAEAVNRAYTLVTGKGARSIGGGAPRHRFRRRYRSHSLRRSGSESQQRLRFLLGQNSIVRRQHRAYLLYAVSRVRSIFRKAGLDAARCQRHRRRHSTRNGRRALARPQTQPSRLPSS